MRKRRSMRPGSILKFILFALTALCVESVSIAEDSNFLGTCGNPCDCVESTMNNKGDNDEKFPVDDNPKGDDGSDYQLVSASLPVLLDPGQAKATIVVEKYLKTPDEMFYDLFASLSTEAKILFRFIESQRSFGPWHHLPRSQNKTFWRNLIDQGLAEGPFPSGKVNGASYTAVVLGTRRCFFGSLLLGELLFSGEPAPLAFCVPKSWQDNNPQKQLQTYLDNGSALQIAVGVLDAVVGMTPILGTADLIFNQKILSDVFEGRMDQIANLCGSVAGDFAVVGKVLSKIKSSVRTAKIVQVASFSSGCGSVVFNGGYLWNKAKEEGWDSGDYGKAAFTSIELISLILEKPMRELLKDSVHTEIYERPKPAAHCLACDAACPAGSKANAPISIEPESLLPNLIRSAQCKRCNSVIPTNVITRERFLEDLQQAQAARPGKFSNLHDQLVWRYDSRDPDSIEKAGGIWPNPNKPPRNLLEHTGLGIDGGGSYVSSTTKRGNAAVIAGSDFPKVADPKNVSPARQLEIEKKYRSVESPTMPPLPPEAQPFRFYTYEYEYTTEVTSLTAGIYQDEVEAVSRGLSVCDGITARKVTLSVPWKWERSLYEANEWSLVVAEDKEGIIEFGAATLLGK
jgi:hypothetical protein